MKQGIRGLGVVLGLLMATAATGAELKLYNFFSPWNDERPVRQRTDFIILHTTEGKDAGALAKLRTNGEANYFLDTQGRVYKIIDHRKVALHSGRSMWNGVTGIDNFSVGIEVSGYHNSEIKPVQYVALRELLARLQEQYGLSDSRVLTHSMVAYAAPNRWYTRSHRGRKRCGMLFAKDSVRERLGLNAKPSFDPDVRSGRLVVGDPYLATVLYGGRGVEVEPAPVSIAAAGPLPMTLREGNNVISGSRTPQVVAGNKFNTADVVYVYPDGRQRRGDQIKDWAQVPEGSRVYANRVVASPSPDQDEPDNDGVKVIGMDGQNARGIAGDEFNLDTTIYFLPDGRIRRGGQMSEFALLSLPEKTKMLVGYTCGGAITARRTAIDLCGKRWNFPSTIYRLPDGSFRAGSQLNDSVIPKNTTVYYAN